MGLKLLSTIFFLLGCWFSYVLAFCVNTVIFFYTFCGIRVVSSYVICCIYNRLKKYLTIPVSISVTATEDALGLLLAILSFSSPVRSTPSLCFLIASINASVCFKPKTKPACLAMLYSGFSVSR